MISLCRYWRTTKLIDRCCRRPTDERAWREFVRRFHLTIQDNIAKAWNSRAARGLERGRLDSQLRDDLVQAVYRKLVEDRSILLRRFRAERAGSICGLLAIISVRVVGTYLKEEAANDPVLANIDSGTARMCATAGR